MMKHLKSILVFTLALVTLCSCQKEKPKLFTINNEDTLKNSTTETLNSLFTQATTFEFPSDDIFKIVELKNNNIITGQFENANQFGYLDLSTGKYHHTVSTESPDNSLISKQNDDSYTCRIENDEVRLYNDKTGVYKRLTSLEANTQFNPIMIDNQLIYILHDNNTETLNLYRYSITDDKTTTIETQPSSSLVYFNDYLYYIVYNDKTNLSQIIQYSLETQKKRVIWELSDANKKITQLYTDNRRLLFTIESDNNVNFNQIHVEQESIQSLFSVTTASSISVTNNFITWKGSIPGDYTVRANVLFDLENNIAYTQENAFLLLSDNGILWVERLTDNLEKVYNTNENSRMHYLAL